MDAPSILRELERLGGALRVRAGQLEVLPPPGGLPDVLRVAIQERRESLVARLVPGMPLPLEETMRLDLTRDPRPDLGDTQRWTALLARAYDQDGVDPRGLFGALHGMRCLGASLEVVTHGGLRLVPGEIKPEVYAQLRREWLLEHGERLRQLLS